MVSGARAGIPKVGWVAHGLCVVLCISFYAIGQRGVAFGYHPDDRYLVEGLDQCVHKLALQPDRYIYYGVYFELGGAVLLWHFRGRIVATADSYRETPPRLPLKPARYASIIKLQDDMRNYLWSWEYRNSARRFFLFVSTFALLWIYLAFLRARPGAYGGALAAVAFMGTSFEMVSHARFAAVDSVMTMLLCLQLYAMTIVLFPRTPRSRQRGLLLMSLAAGLTLGCKATGLFAIVPIIAVIFYSPLGWRSRASELGVALTVVMATFVITTPGILYAPAHVLNTLVVTRADYTRVMLGGEPYGVSGRFEHVWRLLSWLVCCVPSRSIPLSIVMTLVAAIGLVHAVVRDRRLTLLRLSHPLVLLFVATGASLLMVRNYIQIIPLIAFAFGEGILFLASKLRWRAATYGLAALAVAAFGYNMWTVKAAADTIVRTSARSINAEVEAYLTTLGREPFRISPVLRASLGPKFATQYECRPASPTRAPSRVVFRHYERGDTYVVGLRIGYAERHFGSEEVDYDWYPTWEGAHFRERVVVLSRERALDCRIPMERFFDCVRKTGRQ